MTDKELLKITFGLAKFLQELQQELVNRKLLVKTFKPDIVNDMKQNLVKQN